MSFRINREFGRDANKIKNNDDVGWQELPYKSIGRCKQWSGITFRVEEARRLPLERKRRQERDSLVFARGSCKQVRQAQSRRAWNETGPALVDREKNCIGRPWMF